MHIDNIKFFICPNNAHNSYKIVKLLKSFKIIIVNPTCFGLHKPSSGSSQRAEGSLMMVYVNRNMLEQQL